MKSALSILALATMLTGCHQAPPTSKSEPAKAVSPERDPKLLAFCIDNLRREHACFDDDTFWEVFATLQLNAVGEHVGNTGAMTPEDRKRAIGIMKNDLLEAGTTTRGYQTTCETMLKSTQLPSAQSIANVVAARKKSCAEFANAYGTMIFVEGAFRNPRAR